VLVSRAGVVDFEALVAEVRSGRLQAAVDVWPEEPMPPDAPLRAEEGVVLSAHRAGALTAAFRLIGEMVLDDLGQIERGLPPARMQVAARELVGRYRNKPAAHPPVAPPDPRFRHLDASGLRHAGARGTLARRVAPEWRPSVRARWGDPARGG
jgi:hypothetical protein